MKKGKLVKKEEDVIKYSEYISKIFAGETRTDWHEWYGYVWEMLNKYGNVKCDYILCKLRHQKKLDDQCGLTQVGDMSRVRRSSLQDAGLDS